jgi:hypothetical protein
MHRLSSHIYGDVGDYPAQHLINFHRCIDQLDIYHEYALMKMFIYSLNGDARKWYWSLAIASISSLKEFHAAFNKYCKRYYSSDTILEECCERFKSDIQQTIECSSCDEFCEDLIERESKDRSEYFENMDENFSLSISREESLQDMIDDSTDDCIAIDALYFSPDAPVVSDLKEEIVVEEDFSLFLQEVSHDVFSPVIEEKNQEIAHFSLQDKRVLGSPIFDEYSDEEEKIPTSHFVDLGSNQPVYDNYESDSDVDMKEFQDHTIEPFPLYIKEQHCVEINHPGSTEDIEQPSLQINKPAFTMLEPGSADNIKQHMISNEISPQPCSDLKVAESGSFHGKENMSRIFDLQLEQYQAEVFPYGFHDPFSDYMESLSSSNVKLFLSNKGWFCCPFELHFCMSWVLSFIFSRSRISLVNQLLVWLHWKHDFT